MIDSGEDGGLRDDDERDDAPWNQGYRGGEQTPSGDDDDAREQMRRSRGTLRDGADVHHDQVRAMRAMTDAVGVVRDDDDARRGWNGWTRGCAFERRLSD